MHKDKSETWKSVNKNGKAIYSNNDIVVTQNIPTDQIAVEFLPFNDKISDHKPIKVHLKVNTELEYEDIGVYIDDKKQLTKLNQKLIHKIANAENNE